MAAIKLTDISCDAAVLAKEPLAGYTPSQIKTLVSRGLPDVKLAAVLARVSNQCGWVGQEICDPDIDEEAERKAIETHNEWWTLEKYVISEVKKRLDESDIVCPSNVGYYRMVRPFMERNGYRDGGGWWIKNKTSGSRKLY